MPRLPNVGTLREGMHAGREVRAKGKERTKARDRDTAKARARR